MVDILPQGVSGTIIEAGYLREEYNPRLQNDAWCGNYWNAPAAILEKMWRSDAQVNAVLTSIMQSLIGATWRVHTNDDTPRGQKIRDFIHMNLFEHNSWFNFLSHTLLFLPYGFSLFEKVWSTIRWNGGVYQVIQFEERLPKTIKRWEAEKGRLKYCEQEVDGINKIFSDRILLFSHRRYGQNYEGISILRHVWRPWTYKDHLLKIEMMAKDKGATPLIHIEAPVGATKEDIAELRTWARNFRASDENYVVTQKKGLDGDSGYDVKFVEMKDIVLEVGKSIEYQDAQIARAALLDMVTLGESQRSSNALAQTKRDFFLSTLIGYGLFIVDVMNIGHPGDFVSPIQELVDTNFGPQRIYPKLVVSDISTHSVGQVVEAIKGITELKKHEIDRETDNHFRRAVGAPEIKGEKDDDKE